MSLPTECPCQSGNPYSKCCQPYHLHHAKAPTAEALMRSRYSAFAIGDTDYLNATVHPDDRTTIQLSPSMRWIRLEVVQTWLGGETDKTGKVEFKAYYLSPEGPGVLHETSRFKRFRSQWIYVDGVIHE